MRDKVDKYNAVKNIPLPKRNREKSSLPYLLAKMTTIVGNPYPMLKLKGKS
jgi:hypothetical protein